MGIWQVIKNKIKRRLIKKDKRVKKWERNLKTELERFRADIKRCGKFIYLFIFTGGMFF